MNFPSNNIYFMSNRLSSSRNTNLSNPPEVEFQHSHFISLAEIQDNGKLFYEYKRNELKELITVNYGYNLNTLASQFNYFDVPKESYELFSYAENVIETLSEFSVIKNKIELKSLEYFCDKIYNSQKPLHIEDLDIGSNRKDYKNHISNIFHSSYNAENKYKRITAEGKTFNKMGLPLSRVTTELVSALDLLDKKYKNCDLKSVIKKILDSIINLELSATELLKSSEIQEIKYNGKSHQIFEYDEKIKIFTEFMKTSKELNDHWNFYKETVNGKIDNFQNKYLAIYITNRFLLLRSMFEILGRLNFDITFQLLEINNSANFLHYCNEFYLHFIFSLTDLSKNSRNYILKINDKNISFNKILYGITRFMTWDFKDLKEIDNSDGFSIENEEFRKAGVEIIKETLNEKGLKLNAADATINTKNITENLIISSAEPNKENDSERKSDLDETTVIEEETKTNEDDLEKTKNDSSTLLKDTDSENTTKTKDLGFGSSTDNKKDENISFIPINKESEKTGSSENEEEFYDAEAGILDSNFDKSAEKKIKNYSDTQNEKEIE